MASLFLISSAALAITGAVPLVPVYLPIGVENYYFWQIFFIAPLLFVIRSFLVMMGFFVGKARRGSRKNRKWAVLVGYILAVPLMIVWIPSAVQAIFMILGMEQEEFVDIISEPGVWQAVYLAIYVTAMLWFIILLKEAIGAVMKMSSRRALVGALLSSVLPVVLFLLCVR